MFVQMYHGNIFMIEEVSFEIGFANRYGLVFHIKGDQLCFSSLLTRNVTMLNINVK